MRGDQQLLDFSSGVNERIAIIRSLDRALTDLGPARADGVIELLSRVILSSDDGTTSRARVAALAARIRDRRVVSERTIRTWRADAAALGLITVDNRSGRFGGHYTNIWSLNWPRIRELAAGGGRKWGGSGAEVASAPGAEVASALLRVRPKLDSPLRDAGGNGDGWGAVELELRRLGVHATRRCVRAARGRGLDPSGVLEILRDYDANRSRLRSAGAILHRLECGEWPVDVTSAGVRAASDASRAKRAAHAAHESRARAIILSGRREGLPDPQIADRLRAAIPAAIVSGLGW